MKILVLRKSRSHKYIKRIPKPSGKGYNYIYKEDFFKPFKALAEIFGLSKTKIDTSYEKNEIKKNYGVTKETFASHLLRYFTYKEKYDEKFSNPKISQKYKKPAKTQTEKKAKASTENKPKKQTWNTSLMRKIWSIYNPEKAKETEIAATKNETVEFNRGDTILYNNKTGTITSVVNENMVMVKFDNGGFGRVFKKDLEKVNATSEEIAKEVIEENNLAKYNQESVIETSSGKLGGKTYTKQNTEFWINYSEEQLTKFLEREKNKEEKYQDKAMITAIEAAIAYKQIPDGTEENGLGEHGNETAMLGNQNAKKNYTQEDLENGTVTVKDIFDELDNNGDAYTREERIAMQQLVKDYQEKHPDDFKTSHGYLETTDDWYVTEVMDQRKKYRSVMGSGDMTETKNTILEYARLKTDKFLNNTKLDTVEDVQMAIEYVKDKVAEVMNASTSSDEREKTKGELETIAYAMMYQELKEKEKKIVEAENIEKQRKLDNNAKNDNETTLDNTNQYAITDIANKIDYTGISEKNIQKLQPVINQIADRIKRFGLNKFEEIKFTTRNKNIQMSIDDQVLRINPSLMLNPEKVWEQEQKYREEALKLYQKYNPGKEFSINDIPRYSAISNIEDVNRAVIDHEIGHYIFGNGDNEWTEIIHKIKNNKYPNFSEYMIGDYQKNDNAETIAELFSMYMGDERSLLPQEVVDKIEKKVGPHGNTTAMLGNDNAKKDFTEEKPQTDSEMKKEEKKVKETRKEAGLPKIGINYGERVSAIEDAYSLNPNAENYAYKDTGYIAGSQKEKIQDFWKRKKESGAGTSIEEIDWNTLEENPRYAEQQINKANILGNIDYSEYQEKGMDSRVGYLLSRIFATVGKEPVGKTTEARKNYVIAINTLKSRLEECKTIKEVDDVIEDIYGESTQTFSNQLNKIPEVQKATSAVKDILAVRENARRDIQSAINSTGNEQADKINPFARHDNTYGEEFYLLKKYKALGRKERKALWRYKDEIQKDLNEMVKKYDPSFTGNVYFQIDKDNYFGDIIRIGTLDIFKDELSDARNKQKALLEKHRDKLKELCSTSEVWQELGEKFLKINTSSSYQKHRDSLKVYDDKEAFRYKYRDKEYDKYTTWDWVGVKKTVNKEKSNIIDKKVKRKFEMIVPSTIERIGGRNVSVKSTEELKKAFNLREVQTGSYVQSDPVSAKWHTDNIASGLADLADVLGIADSQVSLNGRLAFAIGARGHGKALAHYEPVQRVINITKMKGGGSLGHEWFHAFDNMITEAMNGGDYSVYMSNPNRRTKAMSLLNLFDETPSDPIPTDESTQRVKQKFDNLVKAMYEGDTPETEIVSYKATDVEEAKKYFGDTQRYSYYDSFYKVLGQAKTLDEAIEVINNRYKTTVDLLRANAGRLANVSKYEKERMKKTIKNYERLRSLAAAYFDTREDKSNGGDVSVLTGRIVSRFYEDAKKLDNPDGESKNAVYWSTPHEMAARAFEAYLVDKLKERNQKNDYLSGHAKNDEYGGAFYPYPTERDRIKINKAFDELFDVIRGENAIRKAIDILDRKKEMKKSNFIIKNGKLYVKIR